MPIRPILAGIAAAALYAVGASAQIAPANRPHPEYDAPGVPMGSFRLHPMLDVDATYDDNVYRTPTDTASDVFITAAPGFDLKSDSTDDLFDVNGRLERDQYITHTKESIINWDADANGRVDIFDGTTLDGDAFYTGLHEPRTSPDLPGDAAEPTAYTDGHAQGTITHAPGLLGIAIGGTYDRFTFSNTPLDGGGVELGRGRDENMYSGFAKGIYNITDQSQFFIRGTYNVHDYDLRLDNPFDRSSHGYAGDAGFDLFLTHLLEGQVYAGYETQSFIVPFKSAAGVDYGATLTWYASEVWSAHIIASRKFDDTTVPGASTSDDQSVDAGFDYEILRPVLFKADVSYLDSNFVGTDRQDHVLGATAGLSYLISRYVRFSVSYTYSHRSSNADGQDFSDNEASAGLKFQL